MIRELHEKLKKGEITARSLSEGYLKTIEEKNPDLNAFLTVMKEEALAKADEVDARFKKGEEMDLLAGIPGALKDNLCVAGVRTTAGSKILDNYIAPYTATA
ncbi:MAG: amidase family protein, partial [Candidatus Moraniibacteriota bacterium]